MAVKTARVKCGEFDLALNFKKGVKIARLKVAKTGEISVSLPYYATQKYALEFVRKNYEWLKSAHAKALANLPREDEFRLLGEVFLIRLDANLKSVNLRRFADLKDEAGGLNLGSSAALDDRKFGGFESEFFNGETGKFSADLSGTNPRLDDDKFESGSENEAKFNPSEFSANGYENLAGEFDAGEPNGDKTEAKFKDASDANFNANDEAKPEIYDAKFKSADGRKFEGEIYAPDLRALQNYKKTFAKRIYEGFIAKFSPAVNRKINRLVVRKMATRWGSCNSRKGYINLSLNLIEKSPELVEYVVLHELTHLIYPHHQKSFYDFIAELMPDFRAREKRLNGKI